MSKELTVRDRAIQALGYSDNEKALAELAAKSASITQITNADGYKQCHVARMALKNVRVEIEKRGKAAREDATAFSKAVIAEEKRLIALTETEEKRLERLQKDWDDAIERERQAKIEAEMRRVADLQERVAELRGNQMLSAQSDPELIAQHIADLEKLPVDDSFQEYRQQAEDAKAAGLARLRQLHAAAVAHKAEQERIRLEREELARLRAEQEKREAAERARIAEENRKQAEELRKQQEALAAERREQERKIAEQRARLAEEERKAREERAAEERRIAAERAELQRQQEEARKAREAEERARAEQARLAAMKPPPVDEMVAVLAHHYRVPALKVSEWLAVAFGQDAAA